MGWGVRGVAPGGGRAIRVVLGLMGALVACAGAPAVAGGQTPSVLDSAEMAADAGEVARARGLLERWVAAADDGTDAESVRARYLRARLARDAQSAEVDYLWVAIRGDEPYAPLARLRLAQLHLSQGDAKRALEDLETLRLDFPDSALGLASWLWTGYARADAGNREGACAAWEQALQEPSSPSSEPDRGDAEAALARCAPGGDLSDEAPTFTVQLGAFGTREAALALRDRVAATGVAVKVVELPRSDGLYRVRSGRFGSREDAARRALRLSDSGFEAIVVPEEL